MSLDVVLHAQNTREGYNVGTRKENRFGHRLKSYRSNTFLLGRSFERPIDRERIRLQLRQLSALRSRNSDSGKPQLPQARKLKAEDVEQS